MFSIWTVNLELMIIDLYLSKNLHHQRKHLTLFTFGA